jgi:hypothetical protein
MIIFLGFLIFARLRRRQAGSSCYSDVESPLEVSGSRQRASLCMGAVNITFTQADPFDSASEATRTVSGLWTKME